MYTAAAGGGSGALAPSKGQLISKGLFGVFNSPKKQTKNVCPSRLGQKFEFSSSFFGRIEGTEMAFRNKLTFRYLIHF
mgnify:CR=1 FL=1